MNCFRVGGVYLLTSKNYFSPDTPDIVLVLGSKNGVSKNLIMDDKGELRWYELSCKQRVEMGGDDS